MKRIIAVTLSLVMVAVLLIGCSPAAAPAAANEPAPAANEPASDAAPEASAEGEPLRIAVVLAGVLGDQSYNDAAWSGIERAKEEFNIEVQVLESVEAADWETNTISVAAEGYDLVICVSPEFETILNTHAPEFPDVKFVITDARVKYDNVLSVCYAQNEGSFLAGAAAAMFTTKTDIPGINADKTIGWVGGMDIPALHDFFVGFEQGAKFIDPDIKILQAFAGTFNDPLKGKELTLAMYAEGADIVMNVASNTGNGVLEAAKESGLYAIGVDINQDPIYPGSILCSMVKNVGVGTYGAIKSVVDGTFQGNITMYEDLSHDGVYVTDMSTMKAALGDLFPEDILTKVEELRQEIAAGAIVVEYYDGFGPNA